MLQIFFGDDISASRQNFIQTREEFLKKGHDPFAITQENLSELKTWLYDTTSLFSTHKVLFGENILGKKESRDELKQFETGADHTEILIWEEELDDKTIKFAFKKARLHQFKLPSNIFKFLDSLSPGNLNVCLAHLQAISDLVDSNITLFMLQRRVKELVLLSQGVTIEKNIADWQRARLQSQTAKWQQEKLLSFYDGLYRIEVMAKTNTGYYDIKKALDILLCYYL